MAGLQTSKPMWLTLHEINDRDVIACQMLQLNVKCYDCRTAGMAQFHTGLKVHVNINTIIFLWENWVHEFTGLVFFFFFIFRVTQYCTSSAWHLRSVCSLHSLATMVLCQVSHCHFTPLLGNLLWPPLFLVSEPWAAISWRKPRALSETRCLQWGINGQLWQQL